MDSKDPDQTVLRKPLADSLDKLYGLGLCFWQN